jgi:hypothetical protein
MSILEKLYFVDVIEVKIKQKYSWFFMLGDNLFVGKTAVDVSGRMLS